MLLKINQVLWQFLTQFNGIQMFFSFKSFGIRQLHTAVPHLPPHLQCQDQVRPRSEEPRDKFARTGKNISHTFFIKNTAYFNNFSNVLYRTASILTIVFHCIISSTSLENDTQSNGSVYISVLLHHFCIKRKTQFHNFQKFCHHNFCNYDFIKA